MAKHKIYIASSWRNEFYPKVVEVLRIAGHDVDDFRNPPSGDEGFKWSNVDPNYMDWAPEEYRQQLTYPQAERQFKDARWLTMEELDSIKWLPADVEVLKALQ